MSLVQSLSEGEEIAMSIISNIPFMLGMVGLLMLVITPIYFVKTFKKSGNIAKPIICFCFGLGFLSAWLYGGSV